MNVNASERVMRDGSAGSLTMTSPQSLCMMQSLLERAVFHAYLHVLYFPIHQRFNSFIKLILSLCGTFLHMELSAGFEIK